jgi:uncharacterized membrane protein YgdD (TMEM256/DUF423 family)
MQQRSTILSGAILGFLGVALGAFGAHAFKPMLIDSGRLDTFELAVRYQFYHALALLFVGLLQHYYSDAKLRYSASLFLIGTCIFSGSLYAVCFTQRTGFGMITPLGGICLLVGWALLAFTFIGNKNQLNTHQ